MTSLPKRRQAAVVLLCIAVVALAAALPANGRTRGSLLQFIGRFHPAAVHLPIGFLLLAAFFEVAASRRPALKEAARIALQIAFISAVFAAILGLLLAYSGGFKNDAVYSHMLSAVLLCLLMGASLLAIHHIIGRRLLLTASVALVLWTAHTGGRIVYGRGYLTEFAPHLGSLFGTSRNYPAVTPTSAFALKIQPILNKNCVSCHGAKEHNGGLRLDTYPHVMDGGSNGPAVDPGHAEASELLRRITLPVTDDRFMPQSEDAPRGQSKSGTPLSPDELQAVREWIAAGATPDK